MTLAHMGMSVVGVDISPTLVEESQKRIAKLNIPVEYRCADALSTDVRGYGLVFVNWLHMFLSDSQCHQFKNVLNYMEKGSYLFIRESCNRDVFHNVSSEMVY